MYNLKIPEEEYLFANVEVMRLNEGDFSGTVRTGICSHRPEREEARHQPLPWSDGAAFWVESVRCCLSLLKI